MSANLTYLSKSVKMIETFSWRKVLRYLLAFDEESKIKLLNLISADSFIKKKDVYDFGVKFYICLNVIFFLNQRIPIQMLWIFS